MVLLLEMAVLQVIKGLIDNLAAHHDTKFVQTLHPAIDAAIDATAAALASKE